jgi:hypothetical protein
MEDAKAGDRILVTAAKTGGASREGEIVEVIEGDLRIRYRRPREHVRTRSRGSRAAPWQDTGQDPWREEASRQEASRQEAEHDKG